MLNFIVCDDNSKTLEEVSEVIDQEMMKNNIRYEKYLFLDYDFNFMKLTKDEIGSKIYILDIETKNMSGIDVARKIREYDMESVIIFLTSHMEAGFTVLKNEFMFLSFINKYDNYKNKLKISIKKAFEILGQQKMLQIVDSGILYNIPIKDIIYIERDNLERKSILHTEYSKYKLNKSLTVLLEILGSDFKQSHRSCLVNINKILKIDCANRNITFKNGIKIDLISNKYKKEIFKDVIAYK